MLNRESIIVSGEFLKVSSIIGFDPSVKVNGKLLTQGYIALQADGQGIAFRNIMIRKLD